MMMALMMCFVNVSYTQSKPDSIHYEKDIMTDKEYAIFYESLLCSNDGKVGFLLTIGLEIKNGDVVYSGIRVGSAGIGTCNEKDQLIFLFEDGTKYTITSWNDFNCKGNSWFDLYHKEFNNFNTKKVTHIRFVNGRSYDSFTYQLKPDEQGYFIKCLKLMNEYNR
jgi:hypothetical protein